MYVSTDVDAGVSISKYSYSGSPYLLFETVPAQPGVAGLESVYLAQDTTREEYASQYQMASVGTSVYSTNTSVSFTATISVDHSIALLSDGYGYLSGGISGYFSAVNGSAPSSVSLSYTVSIDGTEVLSSANSTSLRRGPVQLSPSSWLELDFDDVSTITFTGVISGVNFAPSAHLSFGAWIDGETVLLDSSTTTSKSLVGTYSIPALPVPEPGSWALALAGLGVVGLRARRSVAGQRPL